jgi:hypothetical protein
MASIDRDLLVAFFAAADRLSAGSPWDTAHDSQLLRVEAPDFGWGDGACACFVGMSGEDRGVLVFRSVDDYLDFVQQDEAADEADAVQFDMPLFAVNFVARRDAPPDAVKQAKSLGVSTNVPGSFPWLQRFGAAGTRLEVDADDHAFAIGLLDALAALVEADKDLFQRPTLENELVATGSLPFAGDARTVRIQAPHSDAPWDWDQTALSHFRWDEAGERIDAFHTASGSPEETERALAEFFAYKIDVLEEEPLELRVENIEDYLLEHVPGHVHVPGPELAEIPERLAAFFAWLGETREIEPPLAGALAEATRAHRDEFLRRAVDPARFGAAKQLWIAAEEAGVDLDDPEAGARFIETFEARAADAAEAPRPKAWVWQPGQPNPDPSGPCPCGSGKRYKRCCLPR